MQESSLAHYMHLSQREASADVVNASILMASSSEKRPAQAQGLRPPPPQVSLAPCVPVKYCFCLRHMICSQLPTIVQGVDTILRRAFSAAYCTNTTCSMWTRVHGCRN